MRLVFFIGLLISTQVFAKDVKQASGKKTRTSKSSLVQPALKRESKKIKRVTEKFPPRAASGEECH